MIKTGDKSHFFCIFCLFYILSLLLFLSPLHAQEHKKIIEKVTVENIEIPVRVFDNGQPIGGLQKEDFQLYVNGGKKNINGFYELRKKLTDNISPDSCNNDLMTFKLNNIQVVQYEGEKFWAVQARIKVLDKRSRLITGIDKVFKSLRDDDQGIIQVKLPSLKQGRYYIVLEVKDLFSLKSVTAGDAISIVKN